MSNKIGYLAQMLADLYYQDYTTDSDFLQIPHFQYMIGATYNSILLADYKASKIENQIETGFIYPTLSSELISPKDYDVKTDGSFKYIDIEDVVVFPYDAYGYGIQSVRCVKNKACDSFERTKASMKNKLCIIPYTGTIWFWVEGERLYFYSAKEIPDKVTVNRIASIDITNDDFEIPQSMVNTIITSLLQLFKQAANGVIVDMSNDSNSNKVLQSEINQAFQKQQTR